MKIYDDRAWLYEHYVSRRMKLTDICELLEKNYNIKITPQAIYNYVKKYDLLKYRGKGRKLGANMRRPQGSAQRPNPARERERMARKISKGRKTR